MPSMNRRTRRNKNKTEGGKRKHRVHRRKTHKRRHTRK